MTMEINNPEVMAEVTRAFYEYEHALTTNDLDTIDKLFWKSPFTLRYGPNGTLLGHEATSSALNAHFRIQSLQRLVEISRSPIRNLIAMV